MDRDIELQVEGWRALVAPEAGGRLRSLTSLDHGRRFNWLKQVERHADVLVGGAGLWLEAPGDAASADAAGASLEDRPDDFRLSALDAPWQLTELSPRCVTLMQGYRDPSGPQRGYQAHQVFRLGPGRLEIAVALRNLGRHPLDLRMGLRLQVPDGFSSHVTLDPSMVGMPRPARGTGIQLDDWRGLATLAMADGHQIRLRLAGALPSLTLRRHPERPWMTLTALTASGAERALAPGEEWAVSLGMELLAGED
ncbi:hypothetical protein [Roseateles depolymerans]|uniref:Uncharacterized protein n=1 Tax=Roseateles depolymerans TaxID=76731 RepID=A0A0U3LVM7_9BURK|nr:hypothetical protein [Roseateles depolymerans]ALV09159.1 hypothetical protein RD2015_4720 [Roseateles depolymerans]REG13915.1 hypothetical protein DES44_3924 [Roseateles depolymerans]